VFIGCTVVTAISAVLFTTGSKVSAPVDIAQCRSALQFGGSGDSIPSFTESWVSPPGHTASAHSSAICALPSGDLLAVWYGGSREGASDVALYTARLPLGADKWTTPITAMDRAMAEDELDRVIKKVGNAVIFPNGAGSLWMVYVSVSLGGWSGSALNIKTSQDEGRTWGESQRLTLNPFFNLSSLVRNKPIYASDGRIGLPVYHEMALKYPQMLWLTPGRDGGVAEYRIRSLSTEAGFIQPSLVALNHDRVLMMLRDRRDRQWLRAAYSDDNGWTWSQAETTGLPNSDAAIDALRLRDGRVLLAYNHKLKRADLRLALSTDEGRTWRPGPVIESEARREYSYPHLVEDGRGRIHLTYTWERERIKHVEFNVAWLDSPAAAATADQ
jgi:predicted neuraminidase